MKSKGKIVGHLFYMDELKLFSRNETELQQELTIAKTFSNDIRMGFCEDKCTVGVV